MKHILLLISSILSIAGHSQNTLKVEDKNNNDVSKTLVNVAGKSTDFELVYHFYVRNTSGSDEIVKAKRIELDVNCSTEHALCWDLCPPATASCSSTILNNSNTRTITAGNYDDTGVGHLYPKGNSGSSKYRYVFYLDSNPDDSTYVDVNYDVLLTINDKSEEVFTLSPNPANDLLTLKTVNSLKFTVKLVNVLGNVVMNEEIISDKTFDVSQYQRGIYFLTITNDKGEIVKSTKVVLK